MGELRGEICAERRDGRQELRDEVEALRVEIRDAMHQQTTRIIIWMIEMMIGSVVIVTVAARL